MIKFRRVQIQDVQELQKISIETFDDTFGAYNDEQNLKKYYQENYNLKHLEDEIKTANAYFYFAKKEGSTVGYLKINIDSAQSEPRGDDTLEIERIYVRKQFKRQKIGSEMMDKAFDFAVEHGKKQVWLGVWEHNEAAKQFYNAKGFRHIGEHVFLLGDDRQRDLVMMKDVKDVERDG